MKRRLALVALLMLLLVAATAAGAGWWAWRQLHRPFQGYPGATVEITVPSGQGASRILVRLADEGVIESPRLARAYLIYVLGDPPLQAGEYRFDRPLSAPEVIAKLTGGEVVTYPVTLIEGLTVDEVAESLADKGFGELEVFRQEVRRSELIADLDPRAEDLEGYLYPDTYRFARATSEADIVATLVRTFRQRFRAEVEPLLDGTRTVREVVTLASIVEKEAQQDDERALIAGVYAHRLRIRMGLYADPTIIYALKRQGTWDGNLRRRDLQMDSPYNTYRYPGLPPSPICSPAVASLVAAADPADTPYLYFVSRNDGTHVFATTLREHNRNVEEWQKRYWLRRWAEDASGR